MKLLLCLVSIAEAIADTVSTHHTPFVHVLLLRESPCTYIFKLSGKLQVTTAHYSNDAYADIANVQQMQPASKTAR